MGICGGWAVVSGGNAEAKKVESGTVGWEGMSREDLRAVEMACKGARFVAEEFLPPAVS